MFGLVDSWRRKRVLARHAIADADWDAVLLHAPILTCLTDDGLKRLRDLALLFLHEKRITPAGGLDLTLRMRLHIAALACLPILRLDLDWYDNFSAVVVYPEGFVVPDRTWTDEYGVEHTGDELLSGEAWDQGGVILAWEDVAASGQGSGYNVVIHEFAHKLDMQDGDANGMPPLHRGMDPGAWTQAFSQAWATLQAELDAGREPWLDPYAAEAPAEFFAVCMEVFFENPLGMHERMPEVHAQLAAWTRQDPVDGR